MRRCPRLPFACLLAGLLTAATPSHAANFRNAPEPADTRAAAFDATFHKVIGPESLDLPTEAYDAALERLRALLPANDPIRDAKFRSVYCGSTRWKDALQALQYTNDALTNARAQHDVASEARAMLCRTGYLMLASGSKRGLPEVEKAIALLRNAAEPQLLGEALEIRGDIYSLLGEQAKAMLDFQRARAAYRQAGITHEVEPLMLSIAVAYRRMGDAPQAQRYFTQAVARMQDKQDWEGVATNLIQLGFLHEESGAPEKAQKSFQQAIDVATRHADPYSSNAARLGLASTQIELGQPEVALHTLQQARDGLASEHDASSEDMLLLLTGKAMARLGQHPQALAHYQQALPLIERNGNDRYLAMMYQAQAASREALGQDQQALADYKRYNELQMKLQGKMRLEQSRLLEYEYEIRRTEFENRRLRSEAQTRQAQVVILENVRRWQWVAISLGSLLVLLLAGLAWRWWRKSRGLRQQALSDPLTGIANRPAIEGHAIRALEQSRLDGTPMSLLMMDLDHFKTINDRFGHAAGDRVLRETTQAWQAQLRGRDPLGRTGGEEFAVVCPETSLEQALVVGERLREAVAALRFDDIDPGLAITVSIGAAQADKSETHTALFARADAALYRAKQRGRDRVEA